MIKTHKDLFKQLAVASLCTVSGLALAATQGNRGASSNGDTTITSSIPLKVQITDIADISLGSWDGNNPQVGSDEICVWSTSRKYSLTAYGDMGDGTSNDLFGLTGDTLFDTVPLSVVWTDSDATPKTLSPNAAESNLAANPKSVNCTDAGAQKATLQVTASVADLAAARKDTYTGKIFLEVTAE